MFRFFSMLPEGGAGEFQRHEPLHISWHTRLHEQPDCLRVGWCFSCSPDEKLTRLTTPRSARSLIDITAASSRAREGAGAIGWQRSVQERRAIQTSRNFLSRPCDLDRPTTTYRFCLLPRISGRCVLSYCSTSVSTRSTNAAMGCDSSSATFRIKCSSISRRR